ncbi:MAG TPA: acylphosphatase [Anaeromyxobacteraceae bacterium]|nr:acylphosphatase [Anaeromyxobacteraceae bacterium]
MRESIRARVLVSGDVQGVGFRQATVEEAGRVGALAGWVKNLPDGRVEVVVEGERGEVEALVAWLRVGPRLARVSGVQVDWGTVRGDLAPFGIAWSRS